MNDAQFWKLIDTIDREALADGDEDAALEPLVEALAERSAAEIAGFADQLAHKLYALDGRAYAKAAGASGNSDDGFLYARCYVVALGKAHHAKVLADPAQMPSTVEEWCEALLTVAEVAHEQATGETLELETSVSYETGSHVAQWK